MGLRNFHKPGASPTPKKRVVSLTHVLPEEELGSGHSSCGLSLLDLRMASLSFRVEKGNLVLVLETPNTSRHDYPRGAQNQHLSLPPPPPGPPRPVVSVD